MENLKKHFCVLTIAMGFFVLSSCSNNSTKADEPEVATMDSVSKELETTTKELDEKAKKVEESLEKIEKEFNTTQKKS
ncbi:MAG TPA: hypothetical protein VGD22_16730 [Sphingobacteriaceae bacterium]